MNKATGKRSEQVTREASQTQSDPMNAKVADVSDSDLQEQSNVPREDAIESLEEGNKTLVPNAGLWPTSSTRKDECTSISQNCMETDTSSESSSKHKNSQHASRSHPFNHHGVRLPALMANVPLPSHATKPPKQTLKAVYAAGKYKAGLTLNVLAIQSFMAGIYIAMAGQLFLSVGGGVLGALLFPMGLLTVILTSGELFTGDSLIFVASLLGGQVKCRSLLRNWLVSWFFNFLGCLAWAALLGYCSDALKDLGQADYAVAVALKKANQPWVNIFLKGIGANLMVCIGVWQATCAEEVAGKILALWFPITGFVLMGFDHCIANQFLIPVGMMLGAEGISVSDLLFRALLPATLGNIVGGGILLGAVFWYVFDSMETLNAAREKIRLGWNTPKRDSLMPALRRSTANLKRNLSVSSVANVA